MISKQDIIDAVAAHGAKAVHDAAYAHMGGAKPGLSQYGLAPATMGDVWQIANVARELMGPAEEAAVIADTAIETAKLDARLGGGRQE